LHNKEIIKILKLTASLLELYGENQFKVRSYQTAIYNLERTDQELSGMTQNELSKLPGVGKSIAATISEISQSGHSGTLSNLLKQTPGGIIELLTIKGIGARKIKTAWDHLGVEGVEDLFLAAKNGALSDLPGFGAKTQDKILQILEFHNEHKGLLHYKDAHQQGLLFEKSVFQKFPNTKLARTGAFRRKLEVVSGLEYLWATEDFSQLEQFLEGLEMVTFDPKRSGPFRWRGEFMETGIKLDLRFCKLEEYGNMQVYYTGNLDHLLKSNQRGIALMDIIDQPFAQEQDLYQELGWPEIIPELREGLYEQEYQTSDDFDKILQLGDLKGILHNHSTYSDGRNSLYEMAKACKDLGYQYFGISDHSQTAVYAKGLDIEQVNAQHKEIDDLNQQLAPFKIFKGIESDILNDGKLDYPDEVLKSFDFIVASIHFNINMDKDQATSRLINAIENPYTTILGHPTGRQLLKREGYPVDHKRVIEACASHNVVIEINAHPWRLDIDWRWVHYAVQKGVLISINPDAHETEGLTDVQYGVNVARKAGLTKEMTFNAKGLSDMERFLNRRKGVADEISVE
jgi:DNA polymerase (family 10)